MLNLNLATEALYYWAQAVHTLESSPNKPGSNPYLHLGHAAAALGSSPPVVARFLHRSDAIDTRGLQLAPAVAIKVETVFSERGNPAMTRIAEALAKKYLHEY
jgi:hypothetical protein